MLEALGRVYFEMKDLPAAGAVWFLTELDSSDVSAAKAAFAERHGHNPNVMLRALPLKSPLERFPIPVQAYVRDLRTLAGQANAASRTPKALREEPHSSIVDRIGDTMFIGFVLLLILGLWLVGLITLCLLVVDAIH